MNDGRTILDATTPARRALKTNAVLTLLCGVPLLLAAGPLSGPLGVASPWALRGLGLFFVIFADILWLTARARRFSPGLALFLTIGDAGYVVASFAFVALDGHLVSAIARELILIVAVVVALLVIAQARGLRGLTAPRLA